MELVLGTAQLRSPYGVTRTSDGAPRAEDAVAILAAASAAHVDALDTAPAYGSAEATIGAAGCTLAVHTKIDPGSDPATSLAGSLARLQRDRVEILYLHDAAEVLRPDSAVIEAAYRLVDHGVGVLGASVYEVEEFDAAVADPRIGAIQAPLNVFDRRIDEARLARAAAGGVRVYARSVLLQGVLVASPDWVEGVLPGLGSFVTDFQGIARACGRPPLDLAIGWARAMPGVRGAVLGARSAEELRGLVSAFRSEPLEEGVLTALREIDRPECSLCDPRQWSGSRDH